MTVKDNSKDLSAPITRLDHLYGRRHLLQQLLRMLTDTRKPQSVQLVGLPLIGKTSLLQVLAHIQEANNDLLMPKLKLRPELLRKHIFILVTLKDVQPYSVSSFWRSLGQQLMRVLRSQHYEISQQEEGVIDSSDKLMSVLEMLLLKSYTVVFLFDDFDQMIADIPHQVLYQLRILLEMHSSSSLRSRVLYVVTSQQLLFEPGKKHHEQHSLKQLGLLFGKPLYLGLLEEEGGEWDATAFLRMLARKGNLHFGDDQQVLLSLGGRHPYLTLVVYKHLLQAQQWNPRCALDYQQLEREVKEEISSVYRPVLETLPQSSSTALTSIVRGVNTSVTDAVWNELLALGLIVRSTSGMMRYTLCSPLLSALLQPEEVEAEDEMSLLDIQVWPEQRAIQLQYQPLKVLSPTEWRLFIYLYTHMGQVCTRDELLETVYEDELVISEGSLDTLVSRLRQKIDSTIEHSRITTIRGKGYRLEPLPAYSLMYRRVQDEERARSILEQSIRTESTIDLFGQPNPPESIQAARTLGNYAGKLVTDALVSALKKTQQEEPMQHQPLRELSSYLSQLQIFVQGLLRH